MRLLFMTQSPWQWVVSRAAAAQTQWVTLALLFVHYFVQQMMDEEGQTQRQPGTATESDKRRRVGDQENNAYNQLRERRAMSWESGGAKTTTWTEANRPFLFQLIAASLRSSAEFCSVLQSSATYCGWWRLAEKLRASLPHCLTTWLYDDASSTCVRRHLRSRHPLGPRNFAYSRNTPAFDSIGPFVTLTVKWYYALTTVISVIKLKLCKIAELSLSGNKND
jgi:hypothetical protein